MTDLWTWRQEIGKSDLPFTTKGVLWAISDFINDYEEGLPSPTKRLAEYCSLSERAVRTHINLAINERWLIVEKVGFRLKRIFPRLPDERGRL